MADPVFVQIQDATLATTKLSKISRRFHPSDYSPDFPQRSVSLNRNLSVQQVCHKWTEAVFSVLLKTATGHLNSIPLTLSLFVLAKLAAKWERANIACLSFRVKGSKRICFEFFRPA